MNSITSPSADSDPLPPPVDLERTSRSALPFVAAITLVSWGIAAALFSGVTAESGTFLAADGSPAGWVLTGLSLLIVLGGGAALGPLLGATPTVEPSPLKLGLFASLLSPPLMASILGAVSLAGGASPERSWAITFLIVGALALFGARSRVASASLGRAAGLASLIGVLAAAAVFAALQSEAGVAAQLSDRGTIASATLAQSFQDGLPLANPWASGLGLDLRPALAALLTVVAGPALVSPLVAAGWIVAWSMAWIVVAGYLASAALFRECGVRRAGLRDLTASAIFGALAVVIDGGRGSAGTWLSTALVAGFLVAALHAVRRGARPWPGLACLLLAALGCVQPFAAAALALAMIVGAALAGRWTLLPLAVLALLPGFLQGRLFGGFALNQAIPQAPLRSLPRGGVERLLQQARDWASYDVYPAVATPAFVLLAAGLLVVVVSGVLSNGSAGRSANGAVDGHSLKEDRRASQLGAWFLAASIAALIVLALGLPVSARGEGQSLLAIAALLAGLGVARLVQLIPLGPLAALFALGAVAALAGPSYSPLRRAHERPRTPFLSELGGLDLKEAIPMQVGLGEAVRFLRASEWARDPRVMVFREPGTPSPLRRDEPLSLAPLLLHMPLFGARVWSPGADQTRAFAPPRPEPLTSLGDHPNDRRELLEALFEEENRWEPRYFRLLKTVNERGYTLIFIVTESDRRMTTDRGVGPRGVDDVVVRLGAEAVFEGPEVTVYVLRAP